MLFRSKCFLQRESRLLTGLMDTLIFTSTVTCTTAQRLRVMAQWITGVCTRLRWAMKQVKKTVAAELQLHSDQGFQYTSQAYFKLTQSYGITPSMSRKGNPYDNAMAENFFSILKTECIYRHKPRSFQEANEMIDSYIHFYNHERIQTKTGVAPLTQRHFT